MTKGGEAVPDTVSIQGTRRLSGRLRPPGDKSISHRALLLGALAPGRSTVDGLSDGEDVARTARCVAQLGAEVVREDGHLAVLGGRARLAASRDVLDCGNSGTTMRLLCGVVASIAGEHTLDGDDSLRRRPMDRVAVPLGRMGAEVSGTGPHCTAPIHVSGHAELRALRFEPPVASAQVKSAVLLAGLVADGPTTVLEAVPTRAHTEDMLARAGARVEVTNERGARRVTVWPSVLEPTRWRVPADPSQGAFFVVAALLVAHGEVVVRDVELSEERTGFLRVLSRMGADLEVHATAEGSGDVVARPSALHGTDVAASELPSLDEVPILTVAAAAASGQTRFFDAGELRVKESDRFEACRELGARLGASTGAEGDTLAIEGLGSASRFASLDFDADGDHRLAMAAAVAATTGSGGTVSGFGGVATSYPRFLADLASLR